MKTVKKFADSKTVYENHYPKEGQKYTHWVEYTDGTKEYVSGSEIHSIWTHWVEAPNVTKYEKDDFIIFEYLNR